MKVVINRCFGGFDLSTEAHALIAKRKGWQHACDDYDNDYWYNANSKPVYSSDLERTDSDLVEVVEELGSKANGTHADLKIVTVPDDVNWYIDDYDGMEIVNEKHRSWS